MITKMKSQEKEQLGTLDHPEALSMITAKAHQRKSPEVVLAMNQRKKSIVRPDEPNKNTSEPVKLTLPEKSSTPKETPKTETPKSEPNTKQERSSTRPR